MIGPHADSYWARTGRLKIVASVPTPVVPAFWRLSRAGQDSLLAEFAAAGARVAIASSGRTTLAAAGQRLDARPLSRMDSAFSENAGVK